MKTTIIHKGDKYDKVKLKPDNDMSNSENSSKTDTVSMSFYDEISDCSDSQDPEKKRAISFTFN